MRIFPPRVRAYESADAPGPDTSSPGRFLFSLLWPQRGLLLAGAVLGSFWFVPAAVNPWLLGHALDSGIARDNWAATYTYAALLLVNVLIAIAAGIAWHTAGVASWLVSMFSTTKLVARKAMQLGHILPRRTPQGEVLSIASSDADTFGMFAMWVSQASAAAAGFVAVLILMFTTSVKLGLVTLIASPLLLASGVPLLGPLGRARATERTRSSELTGMATDIVAGLRILRGIGGEQTFGRNYEQQSQAVKRAGIASGAWQSGVSSLSTLLTGLLLLLLTWLGAGEVEAGRLTIGGLMSFFGYALFLTGPLQNMFDFAQRWVQALVSARKTIGLLEQEPPWRPASVAELAGGRLADERSGFYAEPGEFTVVVSAVPDDSAALADRLGRYLPSREQDADKYAAEEEPKRGRAAKRARAEKAAQRAAIAAEDAARAERPWGVTLGGVDLGALPLAQVRRHILVSDAQAALFAGTLQQSVDPRGTATREQAERAMRVASAEEVYDALPGGWQGVLDERGRGLSGGQRQRLVLARALVADPEILVLVEPTSAVDAHTEARIAERLQSYRAGRTTVVATVSPLLLHHCDTAVLLVDGVAVARGRHADLLAGNPEYRRVVARALDDEEAR